MTKKYTFPATIQNAVGAARSWKVEKDKIEATREFLKTAT